MNIDKELVEDALDFFWSDVRKAITSVSYPRINIDNLGTFELKWKKLNETIERYKTKINYLSNVKFSSFSKYKYALERVTVLEEALRIMIEEVNRKKEIKSKRNGLSDRTVEEKG